jgi:squalene-associated FAD-dependent desaturase
MPKIAIIGGGMAGLAAATKLTQQGKQVILFEAGPNLGGRARGINYKGTRLDNGQHILLGAYHETLNLLQLAGVTESAVLTRLPLSLQVRDLNSGESFVLNANPDLPAPLHILWGLLTAKGVIAKEKWAAIRFMVWMPLNGFKLKQDQSLASLLAVHQQPPTFINRLWEPLCLAALNTPLQSASAQVFLNVLRDSFAQKKNDSDVLLAKTDLTALISEPIAAYLGKSGSEVNTGAAVESITPTANGYTLQTKEQQYQFKQVILACGPHQLKSLAESLPKLTVLTEHFTYQPITTVYLQYAGNVALSAPMIGATNSLSQWVFDRGQICGQHGLIAVVISAHAPFKQTQKALAEAVTKELSTLFPQLSQPLWHKVITEKRATFSCNVALKRPKNMTAYPNLFIAGDYTDSDYPATIEGAVRSGIDAAAALN